MKGSLPKYHFNEQQIRTEADLIREAKIDASKFEPLYKNYYEQIFLFILKRVESEDIAADITSQVFLKALINIPKYNSIGLPFSSWLYRIARNEIYDQYNKNKIEIVASVETNGIAEMIAQIGDLGREDDYAKLYEALKTLTDEDMELIELRFFESRHFKEIGEILEITENNAKVKTYRILNRLKIILTNER